jgi:hypothetical protein
MIGDDLAVTVRTSSMSLGVISASHASRSIHRATDETRGRVALSGRRDRSDAPAAARTRPQVDYEPHHEVLGRYAMVRASASTAASRSFEAKAPEQRLEDHKTRKRRESLILESKLRYCVEGGDNLWSAQSRGSGPLRVVEGCPGDAMAGTSGGRLDLLLRGAAQAMTFRDDASVTALHTNRDASFALAFYSRRIV